MEHLNNILNFKDFVSGYVAGIVCVLSGQPFDIVKLRMQTQPMVYKNAISCVYTTLHNEGILAFYKGAASPLMGLCFSISIQFGSNELAKNYLTAKNKSKGINNLSPTDCIKAGVFAGACGSVVVSPVELMIVKLQASYSNYRGTFDCFTSTVRKQGIRGLYQGFCATAIRDIPANGIYFGMHENAMEKAKQYYGCRNGIPMLFIMLSGGLAGLCSWVFTYPLDVIKSHIQGDDPKNRRYKTIVETTKIIYREKGRAGFFNGIHACGTRAPIVNSLTFLAFEHVQKTFKD